MCLFRVLSGTLKKKSVNRSQPAGAEALCYAAGRGKSCGDDGSHGKARLASHVLAAVANTYLPVGLPRAAYY